jgi:hypothetical protein
VHFDFDDLLRLRMLQLIVLISCVFIVCHSIIIDVTMYNAKLQETPPHPVSRPKTVRNAGTGTV